MKALAPEIFIEPGEIFCEIQCHHSQIILLGISRKISREIPDYNNPKKFLLNSSSHAIPPFFMLIVANSQNLREISIKKNQRRKKTLKMKKPLTSRFDGSRFGSAICSVRFFGLPSYFFDLSTSFFFSFILLSSQFLQLKL